MAGIIVSTVNTTPEAKKPHSSVYAVRSPTAVPSAKVVVTLAQ
jgi:hypothetical protein